MTDWTDVSPDTTAYKELLRGKLYAGFTGDLYAGSLTVPFHGEADFYAGYIGTEVSWTNVSPDSTSWTDV